LSATGDNSSTAAGHLASGFIPEDSLSATGDNSSTAAGHLASGFIPEDSDWKVLVDTAYRPKRLRFHDGCYFAYGSMEDVDGSLYPHGWEKPTFDASSWATPTTMNRPVFRGQWYDPGDVRRHLVPRDIPMMLDEPVQFAGDIQFPIVIPGHDRREIIFDAGVYAIGYPSLDIDGGAGSTITITYTEAGLRNGQKVREFDVSDRDIDIPGISDTARPGGQAEHYAPLHWRAFRYIKLTVETAASPLTVTDFRYRRTGYPWRRQSRFNVHGRSPEVALVQEVDFRTLQCCTWETFMDCPYWEQLQYVGDTRLQALLSYVTTGDSRLGERAVRLFDASRLPSGLTQSRYPSNFEQVIPPFSLIWILMVEDLHRYAPGVERTIAECLPGCRGVLEWFDRHTTDSGVVGPLPHWNFVDWAWEWGVPPPQSAEMPSATINLQYLAAIQSYVRIQSALGNGRESDFWQEKGLALKDAIVTEFWDPATRLMREGPVPHYWGQGAKPGDQWGSTQHAQAWAILTDTVPADAIEDVVHSLNSNSELSAATYYHIFYIVEALAKVGRLENLWVKWLAPWRKALELGLTTWPESPEPTRSDCHAWSAWPTYAFLTHVLGIKPTKPGFGNYEVTPHKVDDWDTISGVYPTPTGTLKVDIRWTDTGPQITATHIPNN